MDRPRDSHETRGRTRRRPSAAGRYGHRRKHRNNATTPRAAARQRGRKPITRRREGPITRRREGPRQQRRPPRARSAAWQPPPPALCGSSRARTSRAAASDGSSAQGRGLSSATTVYLQVPPQAVLPRPEHRPNCRWSGEQLSGCCCKISLLAGMGGMGTDGHTGHRMLLSITLCFGPVIIHSKTISSPSFLPSS